MSQSSRPTKSLILGVDGGGTSTEAWLAEPGGDVLGRGTSGPSNAKAVGLEAARRALDEAIRAAFDDAGLEPAPVDVACLGLAGFDRPDDRAVLAGWAERGPRGAPAGAGQRRRPRGRGRDAGGLGRRRDRGHRLDRRRPHARRPHGARRRLGPPDRRRGQRLSPRPGRAPPGRRAATTAAIPARAGSGSDPDPDPTRSPTGSAGPWAWPGPSQIVTAIYSPDSTRARIAAMAPEVLAACDESPEDAARLLWPAGTALAEIVAAVARSLGWPSRAAPPGRRRQLPALRDSRAPVDARRPGRPRLSARPDRRSRARQGRGSSSLGALR